MVGPSMTDDERDAASAKLKIGFALLVAVSGALVALQTGGEPAHVAGGFAGGLLLGLGLTHFLVRWWAEFMATTNRR